MSVCELVKLRHLEWPVRDDTEWLKHNIYCRECIKIIHVSTIYTFTCVVAILQSECYRLTLSPGGPGGPSFPAVPCNTNKSSSVNIYHIRLSLQRVYLAWATMGAVEGGHHVLLERIMPSKNSKTSVVTRCTLGPGFPVGPLAPRPPRGPYGESQTKSLVILCTRRSSLI